MLKPLTSTERKVLIANRRYTKTKDEQHLQRLRMSAELWYSAQDSLVEKSYANWSEQADFTDGRVGEVTDVITPGTITVTGLGREALKANTFSKRSWRSIANAMPRLFWLAVPALVGSAATFFLTQWFSK